MAPAQRPYRNDSTAELAERIAGGRLAWQRLVHEVYCELLHRDRRTARRLRAMLAAQFDKAGDFFPWPGTDVVNGDGQLPANTFPTEYGLLRFMGYRVGAGGVSEPRRRVLLDDIYGGPLPMGFASDYRRQWGEADTATRLKKLANCLAAFVRTHKRNHSSRYAQAIADWEADLAYLKCRYYEGRYDFPWPYSGARRSLPEIASAVADRSETYH